MDCATCNGRGHVEAPVTAETERDYFPRSGGTIVYNVARCPACGGKARHKLRDEVRTAYRKARDEFIGPLREMT